MTETLSSLRKKSETPSSLQTKSETLSSLQKKSDRWKECLTTVDVISKVLPICGFQKDNNVINSNNLTSILEGLAINENDINQMWMDYTQTNEYKTKPKITGDIEKKKNEILEVCHWIRIFVLAEARLKQYTKKAATGCEEAMDKTFTYEFNLFQPFTGNKQDQISNSNKLILYFLQEFIRRGWRRHYRKKTSIYKPMLIGNKYTFAFEPVCSISDPSKDLEILESLYYLCKKESVVHLWQIFASSAKERSNCESYLSNCKEPEFKEVRPHRNCFSFFDGVYYTSTDTFVKYEDGVVEHIGPFQDPLTVSIKLFPDNKFEEIYRIGQENDHEIRPLKKPRLDFYYNIYNDFNTPLFDSILDSQDYGVDMKFWLSVFLGRLLYEVGDKDQWQVIPFLKGVGGTGKSTIIQVMESLYPKSDIGVISCNGEGTFGLETIDNKIIYICPEVKKDLKLSLARLLPMISGESVVVNQKYKTQSMITPWRVPGIFAGNEAMPYDDSNGYLERRIVYFPFHKRVSDDIKIPDLGKRIVNEELYILLRKWNVCYLTAVEKFGKAIIWSKDENDKNILPQKLHDVRDEVFRSKNPLVRFLASTDYCELGSQYITTKSTFLIYYRIFLRSESKEKDFDFNDDYYNYAFSKYNIKVITPTLESEGLYEINERDSSFIGNICFVGMRIKRDCPQPM